MTRIKHCGCYVRKIDDENKVITLKKRRYGTKEHRLGDRALESMRTWALQDIENELKEGYILIEDE